MATKKKTSKAPATRSRRGPARTAESAPVNATGAAAAESAPAVYQPGRGETPAPAAKQGVGLLIPVLAGLLILAGLGWWMAARRGTAQDLATPAAAPAAAASAPAAPAPAPAPAASQAASQGRDVASTPELPPPPSSEDEPRLAGVHRETAGEPSGAKGPKAAKIPPSETGTSDALVLNQDSEKPLQLRCWRNQDDTARLDVFGPHNHRVRSVLSDPGDAGWQELAWDGKDDQGQAVPAGHYYALPSQKGDQMILDVWVKN
jgi:hypothetical protein